MLSSNQKKSASSSPSGNSMNASSEKENFIGRTPEFELVASPKWTCFDGSEAYRRPQISIIKLLNRDKEPAIFRLRARDRAVMLLIS